jgi:spermidine/putrescine ABC transporter ATP-binding subunit
VISVAELRKHFKSGEQTVAALNGIDLQVSKKEFFVLLGPSGSGKTTLMRCIAGLEKPDAGNIVLDGKTVFSASPRNNVPPEERQIGMVFQSYAIWPHLTVFENIAFPLRVRRETGEVVRRRVEQALEVVGLGGFAERGATQLSGGQQQRVALARALVYEPAILLLDEPLSNLDAKLREQMRVEIRALQRKLGLTVLYVTHDQAEAMTLSDRIAVVQRGRFEQVGTPEEIYENPATPFVAEFLGRMLSFEGTISRNHTGSWVEFSQGAGRSAPSSLSESLSHGTRVRVLTRPEDVEILGAGELTANQLAAIIEQVAYLGDRFEYHVRAAGVQFVLSAPKKQRFRPGDAVRLCLDSGRLHCRPL